MILYAINIHTGGGKVLLDELLTREESKLSHVFLDARYKPSIDLPQSKITRIAPSLFSRLLAELKLFRKVKTSDSVLMFGNLPPLLPLKGKVILYFQNLLLTNQLKLSDFSLKTKLRLYSERIWLRLFKKNVDEVWVQGQHVKAILESTLFKKTKIILNPIMPKDLLTHENRSLAHHYENDFVYVASPEPHKNIINLIKAWEILEEKKENITLVIILNCKIIPEHLKANLPSNVHIKVNLSRDEVFTFYKKSKCLIFPSYLESFGLPLLEAKKFGLKIFASDLPYAREINCVDVFFKPDSPQDIAENIIANIGFNYGAKN